MAAVLACGPDAALSHRSAAALWRIQRRWVKPVDVTAPTERRHPGIRLHRSRHAETTTHHATATNPTRSHLEDDFLRFIKRHRLPAPETNQRIAGHEVDFVWRTHNLVAELDSYTFHTTNSAFERDRERDAVLLSAGFRTIRITHHRLEQNATKEAKRLRELLR